eukprot:8811207-Pyramimonas_sp.AAC.1
MASMSKFKIDRERATPPGVDVASRAALWMRSSTDRSRKVSFTWARCSVRTASAASGDVAAFLKALRRSHVSHLD